MDVKAVKEMLDEAAVYLVVVGRNNNISGCAVFGGVDLLVSIASAITQDPQLGKLLRIALEIAELQTR